LAWYGKDHGALVFLAHPEAPNWIKPVAASNHVSVQTDPYPEGLAEIPDLDGFGVFMEGDKSMSEPGGAWDQSLNKYCAGRKKPVWGIAELDYKGKGLMGTDIDTTYMMVRAQAKTQAAVMKSLGTGKFYSVEATQYGALRLNQWQARAGSSTAGSGDTLVAGKKPVQLTLAISYSKKLTRAHVRVIRNGKAIIDEIRALPTRWVLNESAGTCDIYRVMVHDANNGALASNPIFIRATPAPQR
jgi:hypothetical protein